jgi:4-hydroxy-2-oxoheptanedioate aldolase
MLPQWLDPDRVTYGGWCAIGSSFSVELMGYAGFDWLCIDLQHGMIEMAQAVPMLQAAAVTHTPALMRVSSNDAAQIMKALDAGAAGVVVPLVNSRGDAERAVEACRYPPAGIRSWGPVRAQLAASGYTAQSADREALCVVMIETLEAVAALPEILSVRGVDVVLVGPSDLATSMELAPRAGPIAGRHESTMAAIAATCRERGVLPGIYGGNAAGTVRYRDMGYRFLATTTDVLLLRSGAQALLEVLHE